MGQCHRRQDSCLAVLAPSRLAGIIFPFYVPPLFLSLPVCCSRPLLQGCIPTGLFVVFGINFFFPCFSSLHGLRRCTKCNFIWSSRNVVREVLPTSFHTRREEGCVPLSWPLGQWLSEVKPACLCRALALLACSHCACLTRPGLHFSALILGGFGGNHYLHGL